MPLLLVIPFLGLTYVMWHVWCVLPLTAAWRLAAVVIGTACFLMMFLTMSKATDRLPLWVASLIYEIGTSALFVMLYLFMAFLLLDVLRLIRVIPSAWLHHNAAVTITLTAIIAIIFVCGNVNYNHKRRHTISLTTGKPLARDMKIVMLSDLHIGYNNRRGELARWVDIINAEQPDVILIAGDIIDLSIRPLEEERMGDEFRRLEAPVYACPGNHEYYAGIREAEKFYRAAGITMLRDDIVVTGGITIIGRDDCTNRRRAPLRKLVENTDENSYRILLDHQPHKLEQAEKAGIDFQFSGHTHHGQVWPISWITEHVYECAFGPYRRGNTQYYVSSGLGIWGGKFRIATCSEYVVATLSPLHPTDH